ncbi:MAG: transglutaminase [Firmicutes bacterium HGW-Firmicutes-15]|nr:MAG: transglutaminase [Firmicutes bacterium HGW-Firmicutes-15]
MRLVCESNDLEDYLLELDVVDYSHPLIIKKVNELFACSFDEIETAKIAFEFVRDSISHSCDIQSSRVTCKASEVLYFKEGICYAKSNLLAAILRSKCIPTGFCYQLLTKGDTPDSGYCIHALNAVYLKSLERWIRLDCRGNKTGVDAQFSIYEEKLAFPIRKHYDEKDYPIIYKNPNPITISTLTQNYDCIKMCENCLPTQL